MDKRIKFLVSAGILILIIVIFALHTLIKRYERESLPSVSSEREEPLLKKEVPVREQEGTQTPRKEQEFEPPIKAGPLIN